jgi:hypothetical protein
MMTVEMINAIRNDTRVKTRDAMGKGLSLYSINLGIGEFFRFPGVIQDISQGAKTGV